MNWWKVLEELTQIREVSFSPVLERGLGSLPVSYISLLFEFFTKSVFYYSNLKKYII